jgi:octaprenyl-diphosphate synthase
MNKRDNIQITKQFDPVSKELKQVKVYINQQLSLNGDSSCNSLMRPLKTVRGKMIRPALLLLSGQCCGKITQQHIKAAAVVEMLHNATLLHDDVIDDGEIRRGKPTINSIYGNESAVLLGDFLLSKILLLCNSLEPRINKVFASTTFSLCRGELTQIANRRNWGLSEKKYIGIITDKTAALFSGCCLIGSILSGARKETSRRLANAGLNLGIAFQLADDLNDLLVSENKSGKTAGRDMDKNKPTLAIIYLLSRLKGSQRSNLVKKLNYGSANGDSIKAILNSSGSVEYTQNKINQYIDKAIKSLGPIKQTAAGEAIAETARIFCNGKSV